MIFPKTMKTNATIGLIAPCSPVSSLRVVKCKQSLEALDFRVKCASNLTDNYGGYMAGKGKERGMWINRMFADPEVDMIICVRSGDGAMRTIDYLDFELIRSNPKPFIGFGDVTVIHTALNQRCDLVTFHGPMASTNFVDGLDAETWTSFFEALSCTDTYVLKNPDSKPLKVLKPGKATGQLVGGNLAMISSLMGTDCQLDTKGKILFLEEINASVSEIERYVSQFRRSGLFENAAGVILGQFRHVENEFEPEFDYLDLLKDGLFGYDIPVMYNIQAGHGKTNLTLPLGATCSMNTEDKTIVFDMKR